MNISSLSTEKAENGKGKAALSECGLTFNYKTIEFMKLSRRNFIARSAVQITGVASIPVILSATLPAERKKQAGRNLLKEKSVILFQGDSITDAGRDKKVQKPNHTGSFGHGYALMAAASLLAEMPEKYDDL